MDAHACSRCGLAVRPTCSTCGEALEVRMHACPRCWEVIEHPALVGDGAAEASILHAPASTEYGATGTESVAVAHVPATTSTPDLTTPVQAVPARRRQITPIPARIETQRKVRFGRLMLAGLVAGLLVAVGLVALEVFVPEWRGTLPDQVKLVREAFPDKDFAISVPGGWDVRNEDVDGKPGVAVFEPVGAADDDRLRRFNIVGVTRSFDRARALAEDRAPASARDYEEIDITDGLRLDGRRTFRHRYNDGEEYREEWWVQRGDGTHRIEFASPESRREESAILFVRIARSFDVL